MPADIVGYISMMASDSERLVSKLSMLVNDEAALERAFGAPGQAGDPDMLAHLAMRWNSVYEEFLDWGARLRGASAPSEYHNLLELLARYLEGYRKLNSKKYRPMAARKESRNVLSGRR